MRVVVTGSRGQIGRYIVRDLVTAGHEVLSVDVLPPPSDTTRTMRVDLTEAGQVSGALGGFRTDAVVHMGAWANPGVVPDTKTYGDNVRGTFNLFQACADLGIDRVVSASSAQVYGFHEHAPEYVRVDEGHPLNPINCYALSKVAGESAAEYFSRRFGVTILSFRFQGVRMPADLDEQIEKMTEDLRAARRQFWTRTDARDAAMACRLAVEADGVEPGPYNITGPRIVLNTPVPELLAAYYDEAVEVRTQDDWKAPLSCERAREAFGYEPRYPWTLSDRFPE